MAGLFGDPGGDRQLAIGLSRVLFPIVTLLGVSGIVVGILNSYERFSVPALSPVFWNVAIIVGLVIGVPRADTIDGKLYVYAVSIVIGTIAIHGKRGLWVVLGAPLALWHIAFAAFIDLAWR